MKDIIKNEILSVITLKEEHVQLPLIIPSELIDYLKEKGYSYDVETNGFQHDFWITFNKNEKKFEFVGSWFYGDYAFRKCN
jgi:hypothetical protein